MVEVYDPAATGSRRLGVVISFDPNIWNCLQHLIIRGGLKIPSYMTQGVRRRKPVPNYGTSLALAYLSSIRCLDASILACKVEGPG